MKFSREDLHAKGYRPDGKGGLVRLSAWEWQERNSPKPPAPAIRIPRQRRPNATESRWLEHARLVRPFCSIRYEAITFRLASGALYTPDFSGWNGATLVWCCEVKGPHIHSSRSVLAFKSAAAEWPTVRWIFAQWTGDRWAETEIPPC